MVGLFRSSHNELSVYGQLVKFNPDALEAMGNAASYAADRINEQDGWNYCSSYTTSVIENNNVLCIRDVNEYIVRVKIPGLHLMKPQNAADAVTAAYHKANGLFNAWWYHAKVENIRLDKNPEFVIELPGLFAVTAVRKDGCVYAHIEGGKGNIVIEVDYDFNYI